ncbi:MAG: aldo/keto reductase [Hylemonella sp.]
MRSAFFLRKSNRQRPAQGAGPVQRHGLRPAPVALAWLIAQAGVMAIPKSASEQHLRENAQALHMQLTPDQLAELDQLFAPPRGPQALEVL